MSPQIPSRRWRSASPRCAPPCAGPSWTGTPTAPARCATTSAGRAGLGQRAGRAGRRRGMGRRSRTPVTSRPPDGRRRGEARGGTLLPLREQVHEALSLLQVPAAPRLIATVHEAFFATSFPTARLTSLRRDEERSFKTAPFARPYYICAALAADFLSPSRGLLAISTWPMERRIIGSLSPRVDFLDRRRQRGPGDRADPRARPGRPGAAGPVRGERPRVQQRQQRRRPRAGSTRSPSSAPPKPSWPCTRTRTGRPRRGGPPGARATRRGRAAVRRRQLSPATRAGDPMTTVPPTAGPAR